MISSARALRLARPALLGAAEAAWAGLLLRAAVDGSHHVHVHLPYLAFAVPVVVATVTVGGASPWWDRHRRRRWRPAALVALVACAALTAGCISELTVGGSLWRVAVEPWSSAGHRAATVAGDAWLVAILTWVRGTWLGRSELPVWHATASAAMAGAAFLGVFAGRTGGAHSAFVRATGDAGWLFFLCIPLLGSVIALSRQRDIQQRFLRRGQSPPGLVWLTVLAVPMAVVAAVAVVVALVVGPAAPLVGRGIVALVRLLADLVVDVARLLPAFTISHRAPKPRPAPVLKGHQPVAAHHAVSPVGVGIVIGVGALIAAAVVVLLIRWLRRRPRRSAVATATDEEERDSVFSWEHLLEQIRSALRSLFTRRRPAVAVAAAAPVAERPALGAVREAYRRVLVEARQAGAGRRPPETTGELQIRLGAELDTGGAQSLGQLTGVYDAVRYGEVEAEAEAVAGAEAVALAVRAALAPPAPAVLTPPPRRRRPWRLRHQ